jgi:hypothetical protein
MQVKTFIAAAVTTFAAFGAFAQEASVEPITKSVSSITRADVHRDAVAAVAAGLIGTGEASMVPVSKSAGASRAQISAEAGEALRLGLVGAGEATHRLPTTGELDQIRMAGERAVQGNKVATR